MSIQAAGSVWLFRELLKLSRVSMTRAPWNSGHPPSCIPKGMVQFYAFMLRRVSTTRATWNSGHRPSCIYKRMVLLYAVEVREGAHDEGHPPSYTNKV